MLTLKIDFLPRKALYQVCCTTETVPQPYMLSGSVNCIETDLSIFKLVVLFCFVLVFRLLLFTTKVLTTMPSSVLVFLLQLDSYIYFQIYVRISMYMYYYVIFVVFD